MKRINSDKEVPILIGKMLEKYNVTYEYILQNQKIDGVNWFQYYTFTEEEEKEFHLWFINRLTNTYRCSISLAEREYSYFNLMWGLKLKND